MGGCFTCFFFRNAIRFLSFRWPFVLNASFVIEWLWCIIARLHYNKRDKVLVKRVIYEISWRERALRPSDENEADSLTAFGCVVLSFSFFFFFFF